MYSLALGRDPVIFKIQRRNLLSQPEYSGTRVFEMYRSARGVARGVGLVHVRTGSRRREFEGERKSSERLLQARERLGLAHRGVVVGGVLDGVVVGRHGADPGRERRPVEEEALVLLFLGGGAVDLALDKIESLHKWKKQSRALVSRAQPGPRVSW